MEEFCHENDKLPHLRGKAGQQADKGKGAWHTNPYGAGISGQGSSIEF